MACGLRGVSHLPTSGGLMLQSWVCLQSLTDVQVRPTDHHGTKGLEKNTASQYSLTYFHIVPGS